MTRVDYPALAERARAALIASAMRRTLLTYKELGQAVDLPTGLPLPHHLNRVLNLVAQVCNDKGEPSLAVLVVRSSTGEPGPGFEPGSVEWFTEAQACYRQWRPA